MTFTYPSHTTKGCVPLSSDVTDIILIDAYHYKFKDGSGEEDYLEKYILPVVGSFDIVKN